MIDLHDQDLDNDTRSVDPRESAIAEHLSAIMSLVGLDRDDPHLADTPGRAARAYLELFSGVDDSSRPALTAFPNQEQYAGIVALRDIPFYSVCAHHLLPFFGSAHIAYLPGERVVGLSKLARVVDYCARRPQVQERLTEQIADLFEAELRPRGVLVVLEARHLCMEMRGVRTSGTLTTTTAARGGLLGHAGLGDALAALGRPRRDRRRAA